MAHVFISYKAERRPAVHHLAKVLENYGYTVWFDSALLTGDEFRPQIERELRDAKAVVVLWCDLSIHSEWVLDEARLAKELKTLVPARIEAVNLPLGYGGLDTIDLAKWDGNPRVGAALDRLLDQVTIKVSRDPAPNFRALSEQEAQWRVHGRGLAEFPLDDHAGRREERGEQQRARHIQQAPVYQTDPFGKPTTKSFVLSELTYRGLVSFSGHADRVMNVAFSPDGRRVVSASADKTALVWDSENLCVLTKLLGHRDKLLSCSFSPDGSRIVTSSVDKTARVWDSEAGHVLRSLVGHREMIWRAGFSSDGSRIVTASNDYTARIWDSHSGDVQLKLSGHKGYVLSAAFSPDGNRIVTASNDKTVRIWNSRTGHVIASHDGHPHWLNCAAFSPDGRRVVTASSDKTARVLDCETGRMIAVLAGHTGNVLSAAFSPDGHRIVTASSDKTSRVWESETGRLLDTLTGHAADVNCAAFSPDGRRVVTASSDGTACVWGLE